MLGGGNISLPACLVADERLPAIRLLRVSTIDAGKPLDARIGNNLNISFSANVLVEIGSANMIRTRASMFRGVRGVCVVHPSAKKVR
jgi:hypothetical protein